MAFSLWVQSASHGLTGRRLQSMPCLRCPNWWLLSDPVGIRRSVDGEQWTLVADQAPALTFLATPEGVLAGGADGVTLLS